MEHSIVYSINELNRRQNSKFVKARSQNLTVFIWNIKMLHFESTCNRACIYLFFLFYRTKWKSLHDSVCMLLDDALCENVEFVNQCLFSSRSCLKQIFSVTILNGSCVEIKWFCFACKRCALNFLDCVIFFSVCVTPHVLQIQVAFVSTFFSRQKVVLNVCSTGTTHNPRHNYSWCTSLQFRTHVIYVCACFFPLKFWVKRFLLSDPDCHNSRVVHTRTYTWRGKVLLGLRFDILFDQTRLYL